MINRFLKSMLWNKLSGTLSPRDRERTQGESFAYIHQYKCSSFRRRNSGFVCCARDIEVYFRDCKTKLAIDKYQIRSANGIKRFWLIASLAYMIAYFESDWCNFSEGYHLLSQMIRWEKVSFIFDYSQNGGDKSALLEAIAWLVLCVFTKAVLGCSLIV